MYTQWIVYKKWEIVGLTHSKHSIICHTPERWPVMSVSLFEWIAHLTIWGRVVWCTPNVPNSIYSSELFKFYWCKLLSIIGDQMFWQSIYKAKSDLKTSMVFWEVNIVNIIDTSGHLEFASTTMKTFYPRMVVHNQQEYAWTKGTSIIWLLWYGASSFAVGTLCMVLRLSYI